MAGPTTLLYGIEEDILCSPRSMIRFCVASRRFAKKLKNFNFCKLGFAKVCDVLATSQIRIRARSIGLIRIYFIFCEATARCNGLRRLITRSSSARTRGWSSRVESVRTVCVYSLIARHARHVMSVVKKVPTASMIWLPSQQDSDFLRAGKKYQERATRQLNNAKFNIQYGTRSES